MTRAQVLNEIAELGATWEELDSFAALDGYADTPSGFVWRATGTHTLAALNYTSRQEGWRALGEDVVKGIEKCTDPECDVCLSESD